MKKFKSALSLLTAIIMVFAMMPGAMANEITPITADDIARYANGNKDGRLIEAGMTVSYGDGTTMTSAPYIVDGFHYSPTEVTAYELNVGTSTGEDTFGTFYYPVTSDYPENGYDVSLEQTIDDTTGLVTLTKENNVIEFAWTEPKSVRRLEMWLWPVGAISTYEIYYFNNNNWVKHCSGNLDQTQVSAANSVEGRSATAYIMPFNEITTEKLRFVAVDFKENVTSAKIAEVVPRSSNAVNLLGEWTMAVAARTDGWLNGVGTDYQHGFGVSSADGDADAGRNRYSSPFAYGYQVSNTSTNSYKNGTPNFWPTYKRNRQSSITAIATTSGNFYYTVRFPDSPQKVDEISFNITKGAVREFEVWSGNDVSSMGSLTGFTLVGTAKGNFSKDNKPTISLPQTKAGEYWTIKIVDYDEGTAIIAPEMYVYNSSVTLFGEGSTYGDGTNNAIDDSIFSDEFYYGAYEIAKVISADFTIATNISKVAKFTKTESGILFSSDKNIPAKRLDLWMLSEGGVKDYRVQISDNGQNWTTIKDGSFTKFEGDMPGKSPRASYFPVIFDSPVSAKNIRLVIDSYYKSTDGADVAYISEAKLLNDNNINLSSYTTTGSENGTFSQYMWGFSISGINSGKSNNTTFFHSKNIGSIWPHVYSTRYDIAEENDEYDVLLNQTGKDNIGQDEGIWYASSFDRSSVRVNKVGISVASGNITEFEVLSNKRGDRAEFWTADPNAPWKRNSDWEVVATIKCNLTPDNDADNGVYFEIPNAEEAGCWMIRATKYSPTSSVDESGNYVAGTTISGVEMYALADYELTPVLSDASAVAADGLVAGKDVTFSVFSCNNTKDADVFFALYSGTQLIGVDKKDMPLSGVKTHTATYTIPANTTETDLSVKAYMWDGTTLVPLLPSAVTATAPTVEETPAE